MGKLFQSEWLKNKYSAVGIAVMGAILLFLLWEIFFGFSPSAVKVLDARVTFKFTAYQDKEQYFVSYSLENKKKKKAKAVVRVQLGQSSLGGYIFRTLKSQNDTAVLEPLETKSFVVQIDLPKAKNHKERNLDARAKAKRVSRA